MKPSNSLASVSSARFIGIQYAPIPRLPVYLFNLVRPLGDKPIDDTVSAQTLRAHGVKIPAKLALGDLI